MKSRYGNNNNSKYCALVVEIPVGERRNFGGRHKRIDYAKLDAEIVKAYIASIKIKSNGQMMSHENLRKFKDVIIYFAAKERNERYNIHPNVLNELKVYINSLKKEVVEAKKKGKTDEKEADPICEALYELLTVSSLVIFSWVQTVLKCYSMIQRICRKSTEHCLPKEVIKKRPLP
mgnify:CR=1 FL=1